MTSENISNSYSCSKTKGSLASANTIDKLHTTQMGEQRIKRNLNLQVDDIVSWCEDAAKNADNIIEKGKNWYVYKDDAIITVNSHSYTIITAHKAKVSHFPKKVQKI